MVDLLGFGRGCPFSYRIDDMRSHALGILSGSMKRKKIRTPWVGTGKENVTVTLSKNMKPVKRLNDEISQRNSLRQKRSEWFAEQLDRKTARGLELEKELAGLKEKLAAELAAREQSLSWKIKNLSRDRLIVCQWRRKSRPKPAGCIPCLVSAPSGNRDSQRGIASVNFYCQFLGGDW